MKKVLSFSILVFLGACSPSNDGAYKTKVQDPEFFHQSMKAITDRIVHDIFSPPVASRIYAYATVAGYEAIIHQDKNHRSLAGQLQWVGKFPQPDSTLGYCFPFAAIEGMLQIGRAFMFSVDDIDGVYMP